MKTVICFRDFTDEDVRDAYWEAWESVGGTVEDADYGTPWGCPWYWDDETHVFDLPECHTMEDIAREMLKINPEAAAQDED